MQVLALDISEHGTGFAIGDGSGPPTTGRISFSSPSAPEAGAKFSRWLSDQIALVQPALIALEAPLVKAHRGSSQGSVYCLMGLAFLAETIAALHNLPSRPVQVQSWRKSFTGQGFPKNPKEATLYHCRLIGWDVGGCHDRADAAGVWAHAHLKWGNKRGINTVLSVGSMKRFEVSP